MKSAHTAPCISLSGISLAALAVAALGPAFAPAWAANPDPAYEPVAQLVQYRDLNLNSQEGIAQLYQRIDAASRTVCGTDSGRASLADWSQARACASASASRAVAQIDNAALTAFYTKRTGRTIDRRALLAKR